MVAASQKQAEVKYHHFGSLTFITTPTRVYAKTTYQMFYLEPRTRHWKRRLMLIRTMIELNEIRSLDELASFCAGGNILWVTTCDKYHEDIL